MTLDLGRLLNDGAVAFLRVDLVDNGSDFILELNNKKSFELTIDVFKNPTIFALLHRRIVDCLCWKIQAGDSLKGELDFFFYSFQ